MAIKGANGISDSTPGTVAVQLHVNALYSISAGASLAQFQGKPFLARADRFCSCDRDAFRALAANAERQRSPIEALAVRQQALVAAGEPIGPRLAVTR